MQLFRCFTVVALCLAGCAQRPEWIATGRTAMVAADHAEASRVGLEVLRGGGNAVDAAVAVSFALGVTRPFSTGLGGGGFMIVRMADGEVHVYDYRETGPLAATADMFERAAADRPEGPAASRYGHLAVAVPNLLNGLSRVHRDLGSRPWKELVVPAIELAEVGFAVDASYVSATQDVLEVYERHPNLRQTCPYVYDVHLGGGTLRQVGDTLRQPALGRLLKLIAARGADAMRGGPVAADMEREMRANGGLIRQSGLATDRAVKREGLRGTYRQYELIAMPPPSSGGVCVLETLNILETVDLGAIQKRDRGAAAHLVVEAMKHAFADRARWLADGDFAPVPVDLLTSKAYAETLASGLDSETVQEADTYGVLAVPEDSGTSHFGIIDRWGNCVVSTETINTQFGSLAAVDEWGLILNNEMDDFAARPGRANFFQLVQSERNAPGPGKRPLSSMSPTIVLKDGSPVLLVGGSGGSRIISSVLNVMINVLDYGMSLEDAMTSVRVHHQWQPDEVAFDQAPDESLADGLKRRGHVLADRRRSGVIQAIRVDGGRMTGGSDPRKGGQPAGD